MTPTRREAIRKKALELLGSNPAGLRYSQLVRQVHEAFPDGSVNTVHGNVWNLDAVMPEHVYKPARGLYRSTKYRDADIQVEEVVHPASGPPSEAAPDEDQFYEPFADWITKELEECTKAVALGGNRFKDKWGTPDVVGIREPKKSDIVKPPTEIVSAEVKIDRTGLITAFG